MNEKNKLKRKTLLNQVQGWYVLIYISQTYTNILVLDYKVVPFLFSNASLVMESFPFILLLLLLS